MQLLIFGNTCSLSYDVATTHTLAGGLRRRAGTRISSLPPLQIASVGPVGLLEALDKGAAEAEVPVADDRHSQRHATVVTVTSTVATVTSPTSTARPNQDVAKRKLALLHLLLYPRAPLLALPRLLRLLRQVESLAHAPVSLSLS